MKHLVSMVIVSSILSVPGPVDSYRCPEKLKPMVNLSISQFIGHWYVVEEVNHLVGLRTKRDAGSNHCSQFFIRKLNATALLGTWIKNGNTRRFIASVDGEESCSRWSANDVIFAGDAEVLVLYGGFGYMVLTFCGWGNSGFEELFSLVLSRAYTLSASHIEDANRFMQSSNLRVVEPFYPLTMDCQIPRNSGFHFKILHRLSFLSLLVAAGWLC